MSLRDPPQAENPASQDSIFNFLVLVFVPQGAILGGRAAFLLVKQAAEIQLVLIADDVRNFMDRIISGIALLWRAPVPESGRTAADRFCWKNIGSMKKNFRCSLRWFRLKESAEIRKNKLYLIKKHDRVKV